MPHVGKWEKSNTYTLHFWFFNSTTLFHVFLFLHFFHSFLCLENGRKHFQGFVQSLLVFLSGFFVEVVDAELHAVVVHVIAHTVTISAGWLVSEESNGWLALYFVCCV
jgi:hypothetical protein